MKHIQIYLFGLTNINKLRWLYHAEWHRSRSILTLEPNAQINLRSFTSYTTFLLNVAFSTCQRRIILWCFLMLVHDFIDFSYFYWATLLSIAKLMAFKTTLRRFSIYGMLHWISWFDINLYLFYHPLVPFDDISKELVFFLNDLTLLQNSIFFTFDVWQLHLGSLHRWV